MIKKIYAILFIFSLIASLPAFGMKKDTFPCDDCQHPQEKLNVLNWVNQDIYCRHILCNKCDNNIETSWEEPAVNEIWWNCKHCSYFYHEKNKLCLREDKLGSDEGAHEANVIKANYPNRIIPDVTPKTIVPQPVDKPTFLPTEDTKIKQSTNRCDCCTKNIDNSNPIQTDHWLNKLEGTCSYLLCDFCQSEITKTVDESNLDENTQKLYGNCKTCTYFDSLGLEQKWNPVTFPCDLCREEKTELDYIEITSKTKKCNHILCEKCYQISAYSLPSVNYTCSHCSYFSREKGKKYWQTNLSDDTGKAYNTAVSATYFKTEHPNRDLPDITPKKIVAQSIDKHTSLPKDGIQNDTFPCDNCHQEHTKLTATKEFWDDKNGLKCNHILCPECQDTINWKRIESDPIWWNCSLCSYFYHHHNQQCWQLNQKPSLLDGITTMKAQGFKIGYPNRVLPKITDPTLFPDKPITRAQKPAPQNLNHPAQHRPANQTPDNPLFVMDNKLKLLGIAGVTSVVCYAAYKTYTWWKGDDVHEKDADNEQQNWEKEEDNQLNKCN